MFFDISIAYTGHLRPYSGYQSQNKVKERVKKDGKSFLLLSSFPLSLYSFPISFHFNFEALVPKLLGRFLRTNASLMTWSSLFPGAPLT